MEGKKQYSALGNKKSVKGSKQEIIFSPIPNQTLVERRNELDEQLKYIKANYILRDESFEALKKIMVGKTKLQLQVLKQKDEVHEMMVQIVDYLKSLEEEKTVKEKDEMFFEFEMKVSDFKRRNNKKIRSFEKKIEVVERKVGEDREDDTSLVGAFKDTFKFILKPKSTPKQHFAKSHVLPNGHRWEQERRVKVDLDQSTYLMCGSHVYICSAVAVRVYSTTTLNLIASFKLPKGCVVKTIVSVRDQFYVSGYDKILFVVSMSGSFKKIKLPDRPIRIANFGDDKLAIGYEKSISIYEPKTKSFEVLETAHSYLNIFKALKGSNDDFYTVYSSSYSISKHIDVKIARIQDGKVTNNLELKSFELEDVKFITANHTSGVIYTYNDVLKVVTVYNNDLSILHTFLLDLMPLQSVLQMVVDENQNLFILTFSSHSNVALIKYQALTAAK